MRKSTGNSNAKMQDTQLQTLYTLAMTACFETYLVKKIIWFYRDESFCGTFEFCARNLVLFNTQKVFDTQSGH
jgi:hypothetical protein